MTGFPFTRAREPHSQPKTTKIASASIEFGSRIDAPDNNKQTNTKKQQYVNKQQKKNYSADPQNRLKQATLRQYC